MNITHIAWLGYNNYGDDVMTWAIRDYLTKKYGKVNFIVWCERKPKISENIKWIYSFRFGGKIVKKYFEDKNLKKTDLLLIGGGSVLHSKNSISWKLGAIDNLREFNYKAKVIGINLSVGPFADEIVEKVCVEFLNSLDIASFRDQRSYNFAAQNVKSYQPIRSFDLAGYFLEENNILPKNKKEKISCVGLALKNTKNDKSVLKKHIEFLHALSGKFEKIKLFSFCNFENYGETSYLKNLQKIVGLNLGIISYDRDPISFTKKIAECDFFIASRLHGSIVPFLLKIPFISFSYHQKCQDFFNDAGISKKYFFDNKIFEIEKALDSIESYDLPDVNEYYRLSKNNFEVFKYL